MTPSEQMARIWDTERTVIVDRAEYEALRAALAEERAIVDRIWRQLGSPTYEQLAGRSIYDLIDELKQRAFSAPLEKEPSFDRDDLIQIAVDAMSNVHDMDVPWRTYAAAVVDALIEGGAIPVWQAIDKAPTDSTIAAQSIALIQQMVRSIEDRAAEVWGRQSYPRATLFIWKDKLWFGVHGDGIRRNVSGRGATVTDAYADILERLDEQDPALSREAE